jgi:hypothetical protein
LSNRAAMQKDKLVAGATCFSTLPEPLAALIKQEELTGTVTRAPCCAPHWRGQGHTHGHLKRTDARSTCFGRPSQLQLQP